MRYPGKLRIVDVYGDSAVVELKEADQVLDPATGLSPDGYVTVVARRHRVVVGYRLHGKNFILIFDEVAVNLVTTRAL